MLLRFKAVQNTTGLTPIFTDLLQGQGGTQWREKEDRDREEESMRGTEREKGRRMDRKKNQKVRF